VRQLTVEGARLTALWYGRRVRTLDVLLRRRERRRVTQRRLPVLGDHVVARGLVLRSQTRLRSSVHERV
jgi:hypothetical protein